MPSPVQEGLVAASQVAEHPHYSSLRHTWLHWGERLNPLLCTLLAPPPASHLIPALATTCGSLTTRGPSMAEAAAHHYFRISAAPPCNPSSIQAVLEAMASHCTPIAPPIAAAAGAPTVSVEEVPVALKRNPRCKAPGPNGIPAEVWAACSGSVAPLLAFVFTTVGQTGCTPAGYKDGLVSPHHKDGCKTTISNYRPITLPNTDSPNAWPNGGAPH